MYWSNIYKFPFLSSSSTHSLFSLVKRSNTWFLKKNMEICKSKKKETTTLKMTWAINCWEFATSFKPRWWGNMGLGEPLAHTLLRIFKVKIFKARINKNMVYDHIHWDQNFMCPKYRTPTPKEASYWHCALNHSQPYVSSGDPKEACWLSWPWRMVLLYKSKEYSTYNGKTR